MNEITLMEAIRRMSVYKNKKERLVFTVTFDDNERTAKFGKVWRKVEKKWMYCVQEGPHVPGFLYDEREAVSAIMRIKGMELRGCVVKYHIYQDKEE